MHGMRAHHLTARCLSGIDRAMPSIPPLRTLLPFAETF